MVIHVVQPGETVYSIARMYNVAPYSIIENNGLAGFEAILPGQSLVILSPELVHTVRAGETLNTIAMQYDISPFSIMQNNPSLEGKTEIYPGQQLVISYDTEKLKDIVLAGSVYSYTDENTMRKAFPFLAYANILSATYTEDGRLIIPEDQRIKNIAAEYDAGTALNITAQDREGQYSLALANRGINNLEVQNAIIDNLINTMRERDYSVLVIDFKNVLPEDKENYIRAIENTAARLNAAGISVLARLYTNISGEEISLLLEREDYERIENAVNGVILMVLSTGYRIGPPQPVNPINPVVEIVERAVSGMPPEKISLCIPNYGFDWSLPYRPGISEIRQVSNAEAVRIAFREHTEILFDEEAYSPYFYYTDEKGVQHIVHFGDARSIEARARLADKYNLDGICMWTISENYPPYWSVLNGLYNFEKIQ